MKLQSLKAASPPSEHLENKLKSNCSTHQDFHGSIKSKHGVVIIVSPTVALRIS